MVPKSFYDLRFSVLPGGARRDAHYICGSLDQVMAALELEFAEDSDNVGLLFASGSDLALDVYQRGERVTTIGLYPFVTIRVDGYPDITFRGSDNPTAYFAGSDDPEKVKAALADGMGVDHTAEVDDTVVEVIVDWDHVRVPPLVGEIAKEGDYVMLGDGPLDDLDEDKLEDELIDRGYVEFGFHDFEA